MRELVYEIEGLADETVTIAIKKELMISEDIDGEVDKAAYRFGYYAVLAEKAETRYQKLRFSYDTWKAGVEAEEHKVRMYEKKKTLTESQMKSFVMSQSKYKSFQARLIQYDQDRRLIKVVARAMEHKKDLVQTKSSNRRNEMKGAR